VNLFDRLLGVDWTQPGAIALLVSIAYVLVRELPRAWGLWRRLVAHPDPMDVPREHMDLRGPSTHHLREVAALDRALEHGRAILGMGDETATERRVRLREKAREEIGTFCVPPLGTPCGKCGHVECGCLKDLAFTVNKMVNKMHFDDGPGPQVLWTSRDGVQQLRATFGQRPLTEAELDLLYDKETGAYRLERKA
jgi:hypothetical protein